MSGVYNPRRRHSSIGYLSPIDYERRHYVLMVAPDADQPAVVLATVKDKPSGRPQDGAVLDRRCARQPHHRAGRDAVLTGAVPATKAFAGFASPVIIIIIASVLVISRAVAVSGVIDTPMRRLLRMLGSTTLPVGTLTAAVTFMSAFVKNVGALGVFMPVAIQAAERRDRPVSQYLMPLAFGSLIGGTITQIGTSPNVLISQVRQEILGKPYHLFDFTPVGLPLSIAAVAFLSIGWRLLPVNRRGQPTPDKRFAIEAYTSEALLSEQSPMVGKTVADLEALGEGDVAISAIIREHSHRYVPRPHWTLYPRDILVLQGDPTALQPVVDQAKLNLLGAEETAALKPRNKDDVLETAEAVVAPLTHPLIFLET